MHVSARDLGTGREQSLEISGGVGLSRDEIGRMVRDAERWTEEDQRRRAEAELRNRAETSIYQLEAFIREHGGKFPFEMQGQARQAIDVLRTTLTGTDTTEIKTAADRLDEVSRQIGVAIYQQRPSL
jgi:molecular chaperone DnaK